MQLVKFDKNDLITTSMAIAEGLGREHESVIRLVDDYIKHLREFGELRFEIGAGYHNTNVRIAILNEQQATFLISLMRNSDVVIEFKKALVHAFFNMRKLLLKRKIEKREAARGGYTPMMEAKKNYLIIQGNKIGPIKFTAEINMINRIVLGASSSEFKALHKMTNDVEIRDHLTTEQLRAIADLQDINTHMLGAGWKLEQRKQLLQETFNRKHRYLLANEQQRLAA